MDQVRWKAGRHALRKEQRRMTDEEAQLIRRLIREELSELFDIQATNNVRITRIEETAQTLLAITNIVTLAQSHDERI